MIPLRHWTVRYGFAVAAVLLGHLLRLALTAWVGPGLPTYITYYPFVMAVALLAGFGPGVLATALTGVSVGYWVLPVSQWPIGAPVARVGLALFSCMGLLMSTVAELYRRDRAKAAAHDREAALRETQREKEFLANLLEHSEQPFVVGYRDGRLGLMNSAYERLIGYTADELRTLDWSAALTPPEWRDHERQKLEELHRTGQPVRYEKEYIRKDGTRVPIELLVNLGRDAAGQPEFYYAFVTEITARKQAEEKLRASEERFRALTEKGSELISVVDATGVLTYESPNETRILGYPVGEQLGTCMFELVHPDDLPVTRSLFQELIAKTGSSRTTELRARAKDGSWRWLEIVGTNLLADPAVAGIVLNARDITARKQAEEALRRSERRYRSFVEVTSQWEWVTDPAGLVVEDIPALRKFTGQTYEQAKGAGWADALHPDDVQRTLEVWNRAVSTKTPYETEYRMQRYDGVYRLLLARGVPVLDDKGSVIEWVGTCIDITERKAAEQALRESEASLKRAQEIGHLGSWELNLVANRLTWSDEVYRIFGLQPQELGATYEGFLERVHPDDRAAVDAAYSGSVREGRDSYEIEHRVVRRDTGEIRYVHEKCQHLRDAHGRIIQSLGMVLDITERKAAEVALRKAHDELEIKVRERTSDLSDAIERLRVENIQRKRLEGTLRESEIQVRFFASQCLTAQETERKRIASELHDSIAASLAAVRLRIERMAEKNEPGSSSSESLEAIASRVAEITTDVRRIMADLRPSILDDLGIMAALNWFCREFQKTYSHFSVERQIGIEEHEVPDILKTPIFRICQEAMNNCAKHSRGSFVKVSLQKEGKRILLSVQDNGQGFDLEKVKKGMGLSNIRERAELSGGASEFESATGEGTTVRVWWPIPVGNVA